MFSQAVRDKFILKCKKYVKIFHLIDTTTLFNIFWKLNTVIARIKLEKETCFKPSFCPDSNLQYWNLQNYSGVHYRSSWFYRVFTLGLQMLPHQHKCYKKLFHIALWHFLSQHLNVISDWIKAIKMGKVLEQNIENKWNCKRVVGTIELFTVTFKSGDQ